ncbi:class I SAM-dependent methyltransferase [Rhizorhabdus dicambivorans]|uniref:Methyltransferase n=1 Tax=Rhizorhabdus dicambivorans TaxID=1850238 RepID=A0A2A4FPU9_9SPHN|nr:methyltransferase domain-containing protein [Rhizorhabdus dicambivorans]ATE64789.1 methyltransferase [Rhizorhabdus dicambivorans]PCE39730.1 methyltransferase [Rhizorhabdus dicambivorans]
MRFSRILFSALAGTALFSVTMPAMAGGGWLSKAVSAPGRPADAARLDAGRKPVEVLGFLGLKPGMAAADIMTGSGYWAEILANAVGAKGKVTAFEPAQFYNDPEEQKVWKALTERRPDIDFVRYPFEGWSAGGRHFDFAIINLNYHDLYWESAKYGIPRSDPQAFLKELHTAMKPGGVVGIIDHVANPGGDTRAVVDKLHRIDPAVIKADFKAAGFTLEAESPLLANPADDHSKLVFAPDIRGKTDRVLYRFRKVK